MEDILAAQSDFAALERASRPTFTVPENKKRKRPGVNSTVRPVQQPQRVNRANTNTAQRKEMTRGGKENGAGSDDVKWLIDNLSPNWKGTSFSYNDQNGTFGEDEEFDTPLALDLEASLNERQQPRASTSRLSQKGRRFQFDLGQLSDRLSPDVRTCRSSPRHSIEAKDFVTEASMEMHKKKIRKLVRQSVREYNDIEDETSPKSPFNVSFMTTLDSRHFDDDRSTPGHTANQHFIGKRLNPRSRTTTLGRTATLSSTANSADDAEDLKGILKQYGLLDEDVNQHNSSETAKLLVSFL